MGKKFRRRAQPRYAGLTGAPDGIIELAWRFLAYQKHSELAEWYWSRTADRRKDIRKVMIVALARKLMIALWRMVTTGEIPPGVELHPHDYLVSGTSTVKRSSVPDNGPRWCCVKKMRECHAVREMKEGPSESPCRRRLQTAMSCFGPMAAVVNVMVKRRGNDCVMYG
jgi:hypothetical protein